MEFRLLRADEIECRVATVKDTEKTKGCTLLLYKDARCDMNILDETVGAFNWQRSHSRDNANCTVSIWDHEKDHWVSKEDVGTESYTEKEKGLASDSFKRACFNWGIGRELYTAPFIWVSDCKIVTRNGKPTTYDKYYVTDIAYDGNRRICYLVICNQKGGESFHYGKKPVPKVTLDELKTILETTEVPFEYVCECLKVEKIEDLTDEQIQMTASHMDTVKRNAEKWKQKQNSKE